MIFYIMGKSASGKDTLYKRLMDENLELLPCTIYTTRPKRDGEIEGLEYHFVDDKYIESHKDKIIEKRVYNTVFGLWTYATIDDGKVEDNKNYLIIGTLESYIKIKKYYGNEKVFPIYLEVSDEVRLKRALKREQNQKVPKYDEMKRRMAADDIDFSEDKIINAGINIRYDANDFNGCVNKVIKDIKAVLN